MRFVYIIAVLRNKQVDYFAKFRNDRLCKPLDEGPTVFESSRDAKSARAREKLNRYRMGNDKIFELNYDIIPILIQDSKDIRKIKQLLATHIEGLTLRVSSKSKKGVS